MITPSRTPGYRKNPRLTASFELNGFWLTGDVARRDPEGNSCHLDRTVDVIGTSGGPVYSLPIEEVLIADCADVVRDCAVIGVPGPDGHAQVPIAVVQPQDGASPDGLLEKGGKELSAAGLATLAAVEVVQDFPRASPSSSPPARSTAATAPGWTWSASPHPRSAGRGSACAPAPAGS
ncbi:hypothetical protein Ait01nite_090880 [Actinoplanes italicus]|uniref:AMP-binding enzyme n=1 Tax=Actinoplanes italicus TaxID=113567 RepID=A0A2T0JU59_9ACTN|nr:AMP-binding enzyme [Actinoplanes italicus]GIE36043.1 hypothetical protein Ait01nite_090880 [Actinoplanes italicus]